MADIGLGVIEVFPLKTDFGLTSGVLQVCKIVISPIHNLSWNRLSQVNQHYGEKRKKSKLTLKVTDIPFKRLHALACMNFIPNFLPPLEMAETFCCL